MALSKQREPPPIRRFLPSPKRPLLRQIRHRSLTVAKRATFETSETQHFCDTGACARKVAGLFSAYLQTSGRRCHVVIGGHQKRA
jgi:hypothetical protein